MQEREGRKEVPRSLGTSDRATAERVAMQLILEHHERWDAMAAGRGTRDPVATRAAQDPDEEEMLAEAHRAAFKLLNRNLDQPRVEQRGVDAEAYAAFKRARQQRFASYEQRFATGDWAPWERIADRLIERRGWNIGTDSETHERLVRMIAENFMDGFRTALARDSGLPDPEPIHAHTKRASEHGSGGADPTIVDMLDRYAARRRVEGKREDSIQQDRKIIELFADFVGRRRALRSITPVDARDFRDTIERLPIGLTKRSAYAGLTIRQAAARADAEGAVRLSPTTVSKYLSTLSPFFRWLRRDLHVDVNVFDGLHMKPAQRNPRPPFTTAQLNQILGSPLFTGYLRDGKEHRAGDCRVRDWRFWIPLVCMFTGARIGEVAQLRVEDVTNQHGGWFLILREDAAKGQRIKNRRLRAVAVHSTLERIGFIRFAQDMARHSATGPLFPQVVANDRGHAGARPSRFWRDYLHRVGLKQRRDGVGSHSFRHTMADELRLADYLDHEAGPLVLGHTDGRTKTTAGYGRIQEGTAQRLRRMMEDVQFEGVDFAHLFTR
jgi:integrase